jgi:hypothetical protein
LEWRIARAASAIHGVSPLLSGVLRWDGCPGWKEFLSQQKSHTVARHECIQQLLRLIDERATTSGIALVALKGAELHARGLYAPGERPMADVDLLAGKADVERTSRMLESLGFHESMANWRHKVFVPQHAARPTALGEHAGNYLKIELHERIAEALPFDITDITAWVFPARPLPGLNPYPAKSALMSHLLLHAAGAMAHRALRLLHLHDIALVSTDMTDEDWDEFLRSTHDHRWWALPPLQLASRYYTRAIPIRVLAALTVACPGLLAAIVRRQRLSDVSLSRLRIDAFPGIEWSQSVSETVRYVMTRLYPGKEMLTLRQQLARTEVAAAASKWHHWSQSRRMVQWAISPPPRPETLHAVRTALAQAL